jgi:photosystem II stability/assembly factor-like uncharacterized protein
MRNGSMSLAACALLAATLTGCSSSDPAAPPPTSASATVGTAGGQVSLPDGAAITVPAGALGSPVQVGLARDATGAPPLLAGFTALSDVYQFTPHGTAFDLPVSLALPFDAGRLPPGAAPQFMLAEQGGPWTILSGTSVQSGRLVAPSLNFSNGRIAVDSGSPEPRVTLSIAAPTNLPRWPAPGPLSAPLVNQPTTITVRGSVQPGTGSGLPYTCIAPPELRLERSTSASAGGPWTTVATQTSTGTADFQVPVDSPQSGWLHFRVRFNCQLLIPPGVLLDASLLPPTYYGYAWVRVEIGPPTVPVITSQPASVTVQVGQSASFAVAATGGFLTYQWQSSGDGGTSFQDIPGATQASYTTPPTTLGDDGTRFAVVVSNAAGSVTSAPATLGVVTGTPPAQGLCIGSTTAGWCWVEPTPQGNPLWDVAWDGENAVAVGDSGTVMRRQVGGAWEATPGPDSDTWHRAVAASEPGVLHRLAERYSTLAEEIQRSTDGGSTWTQQAAPGWGVYDLAFADATTGVAVGSEIWRTDDGGSTWTHVAAGTLQGLVDVAFASPTVAVAVGGADLWRSDDGGSTWSPLVTGETNLWAVAFGDGSTGLIAGPAGALLRTTNGGLDWASVSLPTWPGGPPLGIVDVGFFDATHAVAIDGFGAVLCSADGGASWSPPEAPFGQSVGACKLALRSVGDGVAACQSGLIISTSDFGATWNREAGGTLAESVNAVRFDGGIGIRAGSSGLFHSTDGGATWVGVQAGVFNDVAFTSANELVAVGALGLVMRSANGGLDWSTVPSGSSSSLYGVDFASATTGVAVGQGGTILRSTDGGAAWSPIVSGTAVDLYAVRFAGATLGFAAGLDATLLRTTDAGLTWTPVSVSGAPAGDVMRRLAFTSASTGVLAAGSGLYRTTDGGATWAAVAAGPFSDVAFRSAQVGIAVGGGRGAIALTSDGGLTWTGVVQPISVYLSGVAWADPTTVVAVGDAGAVLRNTSGGLAVP